MALHRETPRRSGDRRALREAQEAGGGGEREREKGGEKMIEGEGDATPSQKHTRPRREETPTHVRAVHTPGTQ